MKTIYSMGKGKYVTLDSYPVQPESKLWSVGIALFSIIITIISAGALAGVDVTQLSPQTQHGIQSRSGY
jgi:hypothetical protein